jgi:hypothetical protein
MQSGSLRYKQCQEFSGVGITGQSYNVGVTSISNPVGARPGDYVSQNPFALRDNSGQNVIILGALSRNVIDLSVELVPVMPLDILSQSAYYAGNFARDHVTSDVTYTTPASTTGPTKVATALQYLTFQGLTSTPQTLTDPQTVTFSGWSYRNASTDVQVEILKIFNDVGINVPVGYSYYILIVGSIGASSVPGDGYSYIMINRPPTGTAPPAAVSSSTGSIGESIVPPNDKPVIDNAAFNTVQMSPLFLVITAIMALLATRF